MAAVKLHSLCMCTQLPALPKFQVLAKRTHWANQLHAASALGPGLGLGIENGRARGPIVGQAASGQAEVDLLADFADKPSDWYAPDAWKDSLGNLSAGSKPQVTHEYEIDKVRHMLNSLGNGHISVSAYDTAWVAMVPALDGSGKPQFPRSVDWISQHQFSDGSWGEPSLSSTYDRVLSTMASVVALATWGTGAANVEKGCKFVAENLERIVGVPHQHMPRGFEIVFPALIKGAKKLGLNLPEDSVACRDLMLERDERRTEIDMETLHTRHTILLHSLEGLGDVVDWNRMLKLQSQDGSFLGSPASTACALMHTGDLMCLQYLNSVLERFDNAVPSLYPVDIFQRLCVVDRLLCLGIARHFKEEIVTCLDYVYEYWKAGGVAWAKGAPLADLDNTAMGFRLLRLHGYHVSENVFLPFKQGDRFLCFTDHGDECVRTMFNLYRASQTQFPGETLLEQAGAFAKSFLVNEKKWRTSDLTKDLLGEAEYSLTYPFPASVPRIENRTYLDQHRSDDIWSAHSLFKFPYLQNLTFLDLAKADFNLCQRLHQEDLEYVVRWNAEQEIEKLDFARQKVVECFSSVAATIYEPELRQPRRMWAQNGVLTTIVDDYFDMGNPIEDLRQFKAATDAWDPLLIDSNNERQRITFMAMYNSVNGMAADAYIAQDRDVSNHLIALYKRSVAGFLQEAEWAEIRMIPPWEEYLSCGEASIAADTVFVPSMFFLGEQLSDSLLAGEEFKRLRWNVDVVGRLLNDIQGYKREAASDKANSVLIHMRDHPDKTEVEVLAYLRQMVDSIMQEVTQDLLQPSELPRAFKQVFFHMATCLQMFYKDSDGYSSLTAMKEFVKKILFQPVI